MKTRNDYRLANHAHYLDYERKYYALNRELISAQRRQRRNANIEAHREKRRARRAANREKINARRRQSYIANIEKERARRRGDYLKHAEQRREWHRQYRRQHPRKYIPKIRIPIKKVCRHCNSVFEAKQSRAKFCSAKCAYRAIPKRPKQKKVCMHCNSMFLAKHHDTEFCSSKCRRESFKVRYPHKFNAQQKRSRLYSRKRNSIAAQILRELIGREKANDLIRHIALAY